MQQKTTSHRNHEAKRFLDSFIESYTSDGKILNIILKKPEDIPNYYENKNLYFIFLKYFVFIPVKENGIITEIKIRYNKNKIESDQNMTDPLKLKHLIVEVVLI